MNPTAGPLVETEPTIAWHPSCSPFPPAMQKDISEDQHNGMHAQLLRIISLCTGAALLFDYRWVEEIKAEFSARISVEPKSLTRAAKILSVKCAK